MGFLSGKILAWRRGGLVEYATTIGGVGLVPIFSPWVGLMMIWFFAFVLKWFPIGKFIDPVLWRDAPLSAVELFQRMLVTGAAGSVALFVWMLVARRVEPSRRRLATWAGVAVLLVGILVYWLPSGVAKYAGDILWRPILPFAP